VGFTLSSLSSAAPDAHPGLATDYNAPMRLLVLATLAAALASAQDGPQFEAASVKAMQPVTVDPTQPASVMSGIPSTRGGPGTSMPAAFATQMSP
jgi:hypothetical protein